MFSLDLCFFNASLFSTIHIVMSNMEYLFAEYSIYFSYKQIFLRNKSIILLSFVHKNSFHTIFNAGNTQTDFPTPLSTIIRLIS